MPDSSYNVNLKSTFILYTSEVSFSKTLIDEKLFSIFSELKTRFIAVQPIKPKKRKRKKIFF